MSIPFTVARGLSGDGSIIVGQGPSGAIRWTEAGGVEPPFVGVGSAVAWDMSYDGSVILGNEAQQGPFIWSSDDGITFIGGGTLQVGSSFGGISDNGLVVFGHNNLGQTARPFRWTIASGVMDLGLLPDGRALYSARGVSADGSIIVGNSEFLSGPESICLGRHPRPAGS